MRPDVRPFFFVKKNEKTGSLTDRGDTVHAYCTPLVGYTVKTNTTDIQTVDSDYSKTIHQEMEEDHKTKHTTKELRNIRVKLN